MRSTLYVCRVEHSKASPRWLSSQETAEYLGIQRATVYAYVSRGMLVSHRDPGERKSRFDAAEVEQLSRGLARSRLKKPLNSGLKDLVLDSDISTIVDETLYYREQVAAELALTMKFEEVADLLWDSDREPYEAWATNGESNNTVHEVCSRLPGSVLPLEILQMAVPVAAPLDPFRHNLSSSSAVVTNRAVIATMVSALGRGDAQDFKPLNAESGAFPLAEELWASLGGGAPPANELLFVLNAAMVLSADHGFVKSTVATLIAAAIGADPYTCVTVGLATASGVDRANLGQGGESLAVEAWLSGIQDLDDVDAHIANKLKRGRYLPGLGHARYPNGDPRAAVVLSSLADCSSARGRWQIVQAVLETTELRGLPAPNMDFALAALAYVGNLTYGSGEAIFCVARSVGWLAHAHEQYASLGQTTGRAF